jgi:hypothetical protein
LAVSSCFSPVRIAAAIAASARFFVPVSARASTRAAARAAWPKPRMYAFTSSF